jgi:hypothetical protein
LLQLYILLVLVIIGGLVLNGTTALGFAGALPEVFDPTISQAADLACGKELSGCCCCMDPDSGNRCPQWSKIEIRQLLVLDLKISGIISFTSAIYLIGAFIVAYLVRRNLANYKTDYVGMGRVVSFSRSDAKAAEGAEGSPNSMMLNKSISGGVSGSRHSFNGGRALSAAGVAGQGQDDARNDDEGAIELGAIPASARRGSGSILGRTSPGSVGSTTQTSAEKRKNSFSHSFAGVGIEIEPAAADAAYDDNNSSDGEFEKKHGYIRDDVSDDTDAGK